MNIGFLGWGVVVIVLLGAVALMASAQSRIVIPTMNGERETPYFPIVSGNNINGETYTLPEDFAGEYNVVMLAFEQVHQRLVETWVPALRDLEAQDERVRIYEVPTLPEYDPFTRFTTDLAMSGGIQDELTRETTITLYTDVNLMQEAIGFEDTDTISVILTDPAGEVYWQRRGAYAEDAFQSLLDVLADLEVGNTSTEPEETQDANANE